MNAKHTPGPWKARKIAGYTAYWAVDAPRVEDREPQVCKVSGGLYIDAPQTEANARLIAAAPELLEALEGMLNNLWQDRKRDVKRDYSLMVYEAAARKALDKARGAE